MGRTGFGIAAVGGAVAALGLLILLSTPSREALRDRITAAIRSEDWETAERLFSQLPSPGPQDWFERANVAFSRGRDADVLSYLRNLGEDGSLRATALALRGQAELRLRLAAKAESTFLDAIRSGAKLPAIHRQLIFLYGTQERRAAMLAQFEALAESTTLTLGLMEHWCLSRSGLGEEGQARKDLQAFVEADPGDRWSRIALAGTLRQSGEFDAADRALQPLPLGDLDALAERVQISLDRGQGDIADGWLSRAPKSHPRLARLRGRSALARNRPLDAAHFFEVADIAEPGNRETAIGMANALRLAGKRAEAAAWTRKNQAYDTLKRRLAEVRARNIATKDELVEMARLCETSDMDAEAIAFLNLVLRLDPLDQEVQSGLSRLKERQARRAPSNASGAGQADPAK